MPKLKRRHFVLGTAAALGALVVGWSASPTRQRLVGDEPLPTTTPGQVALNGWVKVSPDNTVTLMVAAAEMGQGIHTGLAMLLADEMDADLGQVRLEQAGYDPIYNNQAVVLDSLPIFKPDENGLMKRGTRHMVSKLLREIPGMWGSGGSAGIADQWVPLREAGASARAMLVAAAAEAWNVQAAECHVEGGRVSHVASGRIATFGELAERAATMPMPLSIILKNPSQFRLIGQPRRRIDTAGKLDGSAVFGIDALPPDGLLYASLTMCPTIGGRVVRFDDTIARDLPGVHKVVKLEPVGGGLGSSGTTAGAVAVIADTPWHAMRALEKVSIEWDHGTAASLSSRGLIDALSQSLNSVDGKADVHLEAGDVTAAMDSAMKTIEAEYRAPFLAHATMEPMNCTVQLKNGAATVWAGLQSPGLIRGDIAKVLGLDASKVDIKLTYLGGGFGRRYAGDFALQAAALARETNGIPVQLMWSREQDMAHDYYRPAYVARSKAGFDSQGRLVAWQVDTSGSSLGAPGFMSAAAEGTATTAYRFTNARVSHRTMESAVTVGFWRSVNHSQNGFFTESFIDECAHTVGQDAIAFRTSLLAGPDEARHLGVLTRVAELSGWGKPLPLEADGTRRARGLALHRSFGSVVAQVAEVAVTPDKKIRVRKVYCVIDCGTAVNPNLVRQQMESAIVFGLSAALHGEITIERGQVLQSNFHDYASLRMNECPDIEIAIMPSTEPPTGVGEPGTPPVAPAVANAVFALTGQRLRTLPLRLV
ncbi:isoquinoline 1-oxidoreductase beta subunit [Variovorax sp. 54]|uniref:xanthine dehydrogenase family protein molybdopterin-binding subunit n=1 Tax=Variovorax sp. 54 TaxID=2035212 RepID=UPI000C187484|nr:molybdopterin cofactor-binding domain-containing protein [Variovorax sp. 54]PIF73756.1 isoquinoline 1-oxidoreductase beta subunit [Variovorax sp. 54]